jgi:hypothetical protein
MSDTSTGRAWRGGQWFRRFWYGVRGDVDAVWSDYFEKDPRCANVNMVVDLVFGHGVRHRVASTVLDVTWTDPMNSATVSRFQVVTGIVEEPAITQSRHKCTDRSLWPNLRAHRAPPTTRRSAARSRAPRGLTSIRCAPLISTHDAPKARLKV